MMTITEAKSIIDQYDKFKSLFNITSYDEIDQEDISEAYIRSITHYPSYDTVYDWIDILREYIKHGKFDADFYNNIYLKSQHWSNCKKYLKENGKDNCIQCKSTEPQYHHKIYDNVFRENEDDIIPLCRNCHEELHKLHSKINATIGKEDKSPNINDIKYKIERLYEHKEKILTTYDAICKLVQIVPFIGDYLENKKIGPTIISYVLKGSNIELKGKYNIYFLYTQLLSEYRKAKGYKKNDYKKTDIFKALNEKILELIEEDRKAQIENNELQNTMNNYINIPINPEQGILNKIIIDWSL